MDMKLTNWVLPTETAAVGMIPVSDGAFLIVLMICLERLGPNSGEPEYRSFTTPGATLIPLFRSRSWLRNNVLYRHWWPCTPQ